MNDINKLSARPIIDKREENIINKNSYLNIQKIKKEKPVEEKVSKVYVCTEDGFHDGALYQKGDIYAGEPPKGKDGKSRHFEEMK